jgi:uncharacterized membrane protein (UPF0127 family)
MARPPGRARRRNSPEEDLVARPPITIEDERGHVVCERCVLADGPLSRLRGLMGRRGLPAGHGLLLRPSPSIHTCFMRFSIDAVFLDRELRVLSVRERLRTWRFAGQRGARSVLELPAGEAARRGLRPGVGLRELPAGAAGGSHAP